MKSHGTWNFSKRRYGRAVHRARRKAGLSLMTSKGSLARKLDAIWFACRVALPIMRYTKVATFDRIHATAMFGI